MLGSLSNYRALIKQNIYPNRDSLPPLGHGVAGVLAGWTVSLIATPVEHVKARLQVQYNARGNLEGMKYKGPIDCTRKLVRLLHPPFGFYAYGLIIGKIAWHSRPLPRPFSNHFLQNFLLLHVGPVRNIFSLPSIQH
jgi:hypothetical protein